MKHPQIRLVLVGFEYSILQFPSSHKIPDWADRVDSDALRSITRSLNEMSVVCPTEDVPDGAGTQAKRSDGWRCLRFDGTFDLNETGILASVVAPLAAVKISVFALATFDTDFILIRDVQLDSAVRVLEAAGHTIRRA